MRSISVIATILIAVFLSTIAGAVEKDKPKVEELIALIEDLTQRIETLEAQAHDAYTDADAVAANAAPISSAIGTHASDVDAHHVEYTNVDAVTAVDPTGVLTVLSRSGQQVYLTSANLHITNGTGRTSQTNSLGNLIVGYNETRGRDCAAGEDPGDYRLKCDARTGSHMILVGEKQNYTSYAGIVVGMNNASTNRAASVTAGNANSATGTDSSVSGGSGNLASGHASSVSGGNFAIASGFNSSVAGGIGNTASGSRASVSGGWGNKAIGDQSTVSGGSFITATLNDQHLP